ncbi:MAG: hypothetical protein KDI68_06150 [Gammaproteobacteria bacterium]|nr:hypothetical protein [Gammaproteobacteria bacterium]
MPPSEQLRKLSREDKDALRFARNIARGLQIRADLRQVRGYAINILENFLQAHFELEERSLIGRLDPLQRMHESVTVVMQQHSEFGTIGACLLHAGEELLRQQLIEFHQLLERHVHYEEHHFFPYIERCLDEQQLLLAQQEIRGAQIVDCSHWPDPYWKPA